MPFLTAIYDWNEELYEKIQQYLDGELEGETLKAFEVELKANSDLAAEVALHREMEDFLSDTPENELRKNLQTLNERFPKDTDYTNHYWKYLFMVLPFFLIAAWWFSNHETSTIPSPLPKTKTDTTKVTNVPTDSEIDSTTLVVEDTIEISKDTTKVVKPPPKNSPPPPIAANFEPNPKLEFYIHNNRRSEEVEISIEKAPQNIQLSSPNAAFDFQMILTLKTKESLSSKDFKLHIFSNDKAAFEDFQTLSTIEVNWIETAEHSYQTKIQKTLQLSPGLYYYMLEDTTVEEVYWVDKFVLKS